MIMVVIDHRCDNFFYRSNENWDILKINPSVILSKSINKH